MVCVSVVVSGVGNHLEMVQRVGVLLVLKVWLLL